MCTSRGAAPCHPSPSRATACSLFPSLPLARAHTHNGDALQIDPLADAQDAIGSDLFSSLVPDVVRRGAVAFASQRQEWCNALVTDMNSDTEDVRRQLSGLWQQRSRTQCCRWRLAKETDRGQGREIERQIGSVGIKRSRTQCCRWSCSLGVYLGSCRVLSTHQRNAGSGLTLMVAVLWHCSHCAADRGVRHVGARPPAAPQGKGA